MRRLYIYLATSIRKLGFPGGSDGKESACNAGDSGLFLSWKDPLEKGMATHSSIPAWRILENPVDRGPPWGGKESDKTERLSTHNQKTRKLLGKNFRKYLTSPHILMKDTEINPSPWHLFHFVCIKEEFIEATSFQHQIILGINIVFFYKKLF